jgi:uncharacterized protein (TIGR02266 family)
MAASAIARSEWSEEESPTKPQGAAATERVIIEVEVTISSESQFFAGLSGDVKQGGLFVQTYRHLAVGTRVALSLLLPTGEIAALGVVDWTRDANQSTSPGIGIIFEALPLEGRWRIEEFCRVRPPLYHESGAN